MSKITRKRFRLAAKWNEKTRDLEADLTPRFGGGDLGWLFWKLFPKETLLELEKRGFDLKTMRFHIDRTPEAIEAHERMAGRLPNVNTNKG